MTMNRHNYEEFFLMYADNELNTQQRAAVELFVQQNPDLAAELEIMQQIKLQPEDGLVFPDKSSLYKTTDVDININNYEEFFFLYIDRELDDKAREKVEKFVLQHPQLQSEFTLLKQTVLQPEAIVFADKSSLYRKEEERRVVYLRWTRIAVAAAVILIALLGWWLYPTTTNVDKGIVAVKDQGKKAEPPVIIKPAPVAPVTPQKAQSSVVVVKPATKQEVVVRPVQKINKDVQQQQPVIKVIDAPINIASTNGENKLMPVDTLVATHLAIVTPKKQAIATNTNPPVDIIQPPADNGQKNPNDNVAIIAVNDNHGNDAIIKPAVYKEIDTDDDNKSMYVGSLELNKDKIRGFLKKAGRIFGSRPKKDTN